MNLTRARRPECDRRCLKCFTTGHEIIRYQERCALKVRSFVNLVTLSDSEAALDHLLGLPDFSPSA